VRPFHARAETVQELPTFAEAFRSRRAIVPATTIYIPFDKPGGAQRYAVTRSDDKPMALAGLWESFVRPDHRIERSYCVITVEANATVAPYHDRMPLILEPEDWPVLMAFQKRCFPHEMIEINRTMNPWVRPKAPVAQLAKC
jgi:putative SOS response-associated peptidase YedK